MANFGNGVWLVEDKGSWVDNPENLDTTDFTAEGDDYWYAIYANVEDGGSFVADYEDIPGWSATDISMEEGHDLIKVTGTYQSQTSFTATKEKGDALKEFFRNHSDLGDSTFYLVKRWDTDVYNEYPDDSRTMRKYCQVRFAAPPKIIIESRVLHFSFTLRSMWS